MHAPRPKPKPQSNHVQQVRIAAQVYDFVDAHIRQLDADLRSFDGELLGDRARVGLKVRLPRDGVWRVLLLCVIGAVLCCVSCTGCGAVPVAAPAVCLVLAAPFKPRPPPPGPPFAPSAPLFHTHKQQGRRDRVQGARRRGRLPRDSAGRRAPEAQVHEEEGRRRR